MEKKYNELCVKEEKLSEAIKLLTDCEYVCVVKYVDCGNYIIEYNYDDKSFGTPYPHWMDADDEDTFEAAQFYKDKVEAARKIIERYKANNSTVNFSDMPWDNRNYFGLED